MSRLTIETDTAASAKQLASFLRTVKTVTKVVIEESDSDNSVVQEPGEPYNWTNPSRPATDEEFEQMITEAEAEEGIPASEARKLTMKHLDKWIAKKKEKIIFKPKAVKSINSISEFIADEGYPERSKRFAEKLYTFGISLADFPDKYRLCRHPKLVIKNLRCAVFAKNYIFVYKLVFGELIIYNVIHARTNPKAFVA